MTEEQARQVETVRFRPVRGRNGYDMGQVDDFLDQLAAALRVDQPVDGLVRDARFVTTRLREGYDIQQVDRFLDDVVGGAGATAAPVTGVQPTVIQEQRGLLGRLFGR